LTRFVEIIKQPFSSNKIGGHMKKENDLTRKEFLRLGTILISTPLLIATISSCAASEDIGMSTVQDKKDTRKIQGAIAQMSYFATSAPLRKGEMNPVIEVPKSTIHNAQDKFFSVCRMTMDSEGIWLQEVEVKLVERREETYLITGINQGDKILLDHKKSLIKLRDLDVEGLRQRMIRRGKR
jgi:hypothetical protein